MKNYKNAIDSLREMLDNGWSFRRAKNEVIIAFANVLTANELQAIWKLER